jgi:hypothetical protein
MADPQRVLLRPKIIAGPFWQRHRHYLVPDRPFAGDTGSFYVVDATTGRRYAWGIWPRGSTMIGVPTIWTYIHRDWTSRAFYLEPLATPWRLPPDGGPDRDDRGIFSRALTWLRSRLL